MPLYVQLPPNLCKDIQHEGKSVYYRDYCSKYNGKMPSKQSVSYTTLIQCPSKNKRLGDHFSTLPSDHIRQTSLKQTNRQAIRNDRKDDKYALKGDINNRKVKSAVPFDDNCLRESVAKTLSNIEAAWIREAEIDKQQRRYNINGLAGSKKMAVFHKDEVKKEQSVPGLNDWLNTSDEYEKRVVHKFLTNITSTGDDITPPSTASSEGAQLKVVRIHSPPKSAPILLTRRGTPKASIDPQITSTEECSIVDLVEKSSSSRASSRSSSKSCDGGMLNVSTQAPCDMNSKPNSGSKHNRSRTAPELQHSCHHCEACKRKIYKRMLQDLEGSYPNTYEELKQEKCKDQKTSSIYLYRPVEDYAHCGTSFQHVNGRQKGYFIIHPDFVSENRNMAWKKWKTNKKHLGESKSIF